MRLTLETERLILRPFEKSDALPMFEGWANDPEVTKYLTWNPHKDLEETVARIDRWIAEYEKPERLNFAIERKGTQDLIGTIGVVGYLGGVKGTPVIGYTSSRAVWGNGYMTEACKCLLAYLFSIGYKEVRIDARVENIASNRVIQKCGGKWIAVEEEVLEEKENQKVMVNRYLVTAPDK